MKKLLWLIAVALPLLLNPSYAASDIVKGKVVQYKTNMGIEQVEVRMTKIDARKTEVAKTKTNEQGLFELKYSKELTQFHLRFDPPAGYYVSGRVRVDRSGSKMHVDTMGLVNKNNKDIESSAKQQRDAINYVDSGGDPGKTKKEIEFARKHFGEKKFRSALKMQNWLKRRSAKLRIPLE